LLYGVVCLVDLCYDVSMKLYYDKRSKDPIYYVQQGFRNGKKTTTKNVAKVGRHSELLKITEDPLAYAKEQIAKYNEEYRNNKISMDLTINFDEKLKATDNVVSSSNLLNIGYFFLQSIYHDLNLNSFFKSATEGSKITYDPNQVNRFLTYARILEPDSKLGTYDHLHKYYEQPEFNYIHILRTMNIMVDNYQSYLSHLFKHSERIIKRDTSVCYFDCSNYYFETECPDDDYVDTVTGEIVKGLRKYGVSKDHKPNPIVQMGLFIDAKGIPLSMCINPGSSNEQTCVIPMETELVKMFDGKQFIYCADAGLNSFDIRAFNSMGGRAFVVTQSIKKLSRPLQQAVFNDFSYRLLSTNKPVEINELKSFDTDDKANISLYNDKAYKVIAADKAIDIGLYEDRLLSNGKFKRVKSKAVLKQKIIITFSRKAMEYQRTIRNRQIERAKNLLKNIDPGTYKKGPHDVTRFIKRVSNVNSNEKYIIDQDAINKEARYDGFYAVATNLDADVKSILDINAQRYKVEDCFRIMKTNFSARPVFHQTRDRIIAHFMICYTALLIYRLLEAKLDAYGTHFTTENIIETLRNMEVSNLEDICYHSSYSASQACTALNGVFGLALDKKFYQPKELNKKIKKISK